MNNNKMKKCIYCRSEIDYHAVYCPHCAKQQGKTKKCPYCKTEILKSEKVNCPNCGKNLKKVNYIIIGFFIFFGLLAIAMGQVSPNTTNNSNKTSTAQIIKVMNVDEIQANEIINVLNSVGVSNINKIARDDGLDDYYWNGGTDKGYRVAYSDFNTNDIHRTVIVNLNDDGSVLAVKMAAPDAPVLYENGEIKDYLTNYTTNDEERYNYKKLADDLILQVLKSPSTAKFPKISEYSFDKEKGIVTVQGYVDSQNSYGATVRGDFQVKFNGSTAISLIFEGKEYLN